MAAFETAIRGGTVVSSSGRQPLDVYITDGRIAHLAAPDRPADAAQVIDAHGCLVLPGLIDSHVHFMEPGDKDREDFLTGTSAAALRGVTTVIEHTHSWPVNEPERLREKVAHLRDRARVDFGLAAHVWPDKLDQIAALWRAGVSYFKAFTCATHGVPAIDADRLLELAGELGELGAPCLVHSEDDLMTARNERRLREAMRVDGRVIPEWRSREAELVAVGTVATIARITEARFIIAHASSADVLDVVRREREIGSPLMAESCPQYMYLRESEVEEYGPFRKFTPPARIRSEEDRRRMWQAFTDGTVHLLSSDHAPSTREQKMAGDIWQVHFGLPGIDTTAPLMLTAALQGQVTVERIVAAYAEAPARIYGLAGKGRIEPGADADLLVFDPQGSSELEDSDVNSRAGWTPYAGAVVNGHMRHVLLRGMQVALDGELVESPPAGRFLPGAGYRP